MSAPIPAIADVLPHRPPFLFVDEIVELGEKWVLARRTVRAEEPYFQGHYPGRPIMPGVLLCEAALQTGSYLLATRVVSTIQPEGSVPVVTRMNEVKFKRMAKPGDVLDIRAEVEDVVMGVVFMKADIRCAGKMIASLTFAVTLARPEPEPM